MDQAHPGASTNRKARRVQQGRVSQSSSGRAAQSEHSAQWRQPPTVRYGEDQSGASWHHQVSFQEPLSYGNSPSSISSRSTSSIEQSAIGEPLQEFAPQNSFNPQVLQDNSVTSAYIWPQNDGDDVSHSFVGQTVVPYLSAAAPPILKRKRELDSPTQVLLPYFHRDWHPVPQNLSAEYGQAGTVLCSRCNIYESLFGVPGFCSSCLQVSFNPQPSAVGTRNENLESLVLFLIPAHMEDVLSSAPTNMPRSRSWRMLPHKNQVIKYDSGEEGFHYRWNYLKRLVMSTQLFSDDFAELANIAQMYQVSIPVKSKSLETCCTALISVCELYNTVIGVPETTRTPQIISIPKLISNIRATRITVRHAFQQYQKLAAAPSDSRDRQDWIPAFLSASLLTVAAIFFLDIMVACPSPYKEQIWGEAWNERIVDMRNGGYGMLISLLRVNSGGINPMKMDCWVEKSPPVSPPFDPFINATAKSYSPAHHPPPKKRNKSNTTTNANTTSHAPATISSARPNMQQERNILLGRSSPAALQGMLALQEWNQKYGDILEQGKDVFKQPLFRLATASPLAGLWRIFELQ